MGDGTYDPNAVLATLEGGSGGSSYAAGTSQATPGLGTTDAESAFYDVYMGRYPRPDIGPGTHADFGQKGPTDRGPAMHFDPKRAPWPDQKAAGQVYGAYGKDKTVSIDDALKHIYDEKAEKDFTDLLLKQGVVDKTDFSIDDVHKWWETAVTESAKLYKFAGRKVTPQDWIEMYAGVNGLGGGSGAGGGQGGAYTTTNTETQVQHFDDLDARGMADDAYAQALGRRAKGKESSALQHALNAYAQAHPQISTSVTDHDAKGNSDTTSTSKGGVSSGGLQELAQDQARANPHYAEYQAATTYFNALQQALGATANV